MKVLLSNTQSGNFDLPLNERFIPASKIDRCHTLSVFFPPEALSLVPCLKVLGGGVIGSPVSRVRMFRLSSQFSSQSHQLFLVNELIQIVDEVARNISQQHYKLSYMKMLQAMQFIVGSLFASSWTRDLVFC